MTLGARSSNGDINELFTKYSINCGLPEQSCISVVIAANGPDAGNSRQGALPD
jgi:hypothetical protein